MDSVILIGLMGTILASILGLIGVLLKMMRGNGSGKDKEKAQTNGLIEYRLSGIDLKILGVDTQLGTINTRLGGVESQLTLCIGRLENLEFVAKELKSR